MSITVVTTEHGTNKFPEANYWETMAGIDGDEGNLWIGTAPGEDNAIAEFAKGSWVYVQFEAVEPRVWSSIKDIPEGVVARDKAGWFWKVFESQSASSFSNGDSWSSFDAFRTTEDSYGPFTEVLA